MATAQTDRPITPEAVLFNGTNPKDESENLVIKYFPKTGVEETITQFEASRNNSMIYLEG